MLLTIHPPSLTNRSGKADWSDYLEIHDKRLAHAYLGKKIPVDTVVEQYMLGNIDMKKDLLEVFLYRNHIFRFVFTMNNIAWFVRDFVMQMTANRLERRRPNSW